MSDGDLFWTALGAAATLLGALILCFCYVAKDKDE